MTFPGRRESMEYAKRRWTVRSNLYADAELMMILEADTSHYSKDSLPPERSETIGCYLLERQRHKDTLLHPPTEIGGRETVIAYRFFLEDHTPTTPRSTEGSHTLEG